MADILPKYRTEELDHPSMVLPGYRKWGSMYDMNELPTGSRRYVSDWWPALSLSIFREHPDGGRLQTLTGIRQADTHDGVVSTLTSALPQEIVPGLVWAKRLSLAADYPTVRIGQNGPNAQEMAVVATYRPNIQQVPENTDILPLLCHDVLSRKLGRPDLIDMRWGETHLGHVSLSAVTIGFSYVDDDPDGTPLWEPLMMFGAAMILNKQYADALSDPAVRYKRYRNLGWTDNIDTFADDVTSKNIVQLAPSVPEGEAVQFCARGLCLSTTALLVQKNDLRAHLGLAA